jgi:hypothetical protein
MTTNVLQFECPDATVAAQLQQIITNQANTWARLNWLTTDPNYVTAMFGSEQWNVHTTNAQLYWANYDAIYAQLGADGQAIADAMLGSGPMQGILKQAPLIASMPACMLAVVSIDDLVASGYQTPPKNTQP